MSFIDRYKDDQQKRKQARAEKVARLKARREEIRAGKKRGNTKAGQVEKYLGETQGVFSPGKRKEETEAPHLLARRAFENGDGVIQFALPVVETRRGWSRISGWPDDVARSQSRHSSAIEAIEAEGWKLEHASYVFEQTGFLSRDQFMKSGQAARVTGQILGIYIFRRDEAGKANQEPSPSG
jgi:hypothetical protein